MKVALRVLALIPLQGKNDSRDPQIRRVSVADDPALLPQGPERKRLCTACDGE